MEKDREATEQRLINAIGELIEEKGFEKLGINAVAERAGVSKMLIYRYFDSLDGLIKRYIQTYDFWINAPEEYPPLPELKDYLKKMFREQIFQFRKNISLKRLRRWELSSDSSIVQEVWQNREENGVRLTEFVSKLTKFPDKEIAAIAAIINAAITYLVLLEDQCPVYTGINIQTDEGWEQIATGIDTLIDFLI